MQAHTIGSCQKSSPTETPIQPAPKGPEEIRKESNACHVIDYENERRVRHDPISPAYIMHRSFNSRVLVGRMGEGKKKKDS
jgi:hypothetical protein